MTYFTNSFVTEQYPEELMCGLCNKPFNLHNNVQELSLFRIINPDNSPYETCARRYSDYNRMSVFTDFDIIEGYHFPLEPLPMDYWQVANNPHLVLPYQDYSYDPAGIFEEELLLDANQGHEPEFEELHDYYLQELAALDALDNWTDNEPTQCTIAIDRWLNTSAPVQYAQPLTSPKAFPEMSYQPSTPLATDKVREASPINPEVIHNFTSQVLINPELTDAFQKRVFNYWKGNDGKYHIGQLTLGRTPQGQPTATCTHPWCYNKDTGRQTTYYFQGDYINPSRSAMEDWLLRLIRHGNNHGPFWLTSRPDFTYLHAENCDTSKHHIQYKTQMFKSYGKYVTAQVPISTRCNTERPVFVATELTPDSLLDCYQFLKEHQRYCQDTRCTCAEYESMLWDCIYGNTLTHNLTTLNVLA